jgi:hypothetical protein
LAGPAKSGSWLVSVMPPYYSIKYL